MGVSHSGRLVPEKADSARDCVLASPLEVLVKGAPLKYGFEGRQTRRSDSLKCARHRRLQAIIKGIHQTHP